MQKEKSPSQFPNVVCWNRESRPAVFDTVALRVEDPVFNATHTHIPLLRRDPATGAEAGGYEERELLEQLLKKDKRHSFCVIGGAPGTGKSHLIKWLYKQIEGGTIRLAEKAHTILVPRDSANLATVLEKILRGFEGPNIDKIRSEISNASNISTIGAMNHVLDQLAFAIDPLNIESTRLEFPEDEANEIILSCLPPMLRDQSIRSALINDTEDGIVAKLARHVFGKRSKRPDEEGRREWHESDLYFPPNVTARAGEAAREMANSLYADKELRKNAATVLNQALSEAFPRLVGLRRGSLRDAFFEIRRELKAKRRQLVLLIEDLSIAQGMDEELIEALQVTPMDGGTDLCVLRSVVGVTEDDLRRLYTNIRERIDLAVEFNMPINDPKLGEEFVVRFAAKYLNATRYSMSTLQEWESSHKLNEELPSFCQVSQCSNRIKCHEAFGEVDGYGLYPLSRHALMRLYECRLQPTSNEENATKPFNPRLLVGRVMGEFLERSEDSIQRSTFPPARLLEWFRLVPGIDSQKLLHLDHLDRIEHVYGEMEGRKVEGLIEIYSLRPQDGKVNRKIAELFGVSLNQKEIETKEPDSTSIPPSIPKRPRVSTDDKFGEWGRKKTLSQSNLSGWRSSLYYALKAFHDWDSDEVSYLFYNNQIFQPSHISFQGMETSSIKRGASLEVKATVKNAIAMRGIVTRFESGDQKEFLYACEMLEELCNSLAHTLNSLSKTKGKVKPIDIALQIVLIDNALRGNLPQNPSQKEIVNAIFRNPEKALCSLDDERTPQSIITQPWRRVLHIFDSEEMVEVREWLRKRISARKGGSSELAIINAHNILSIVGPATSGVQPMLSNVDKSSWNKDIYRPMLLFLGKLQGRFKLGFVNQIKELKSFQRSITELFGGSPTSAKLENICTAIRQGISEDLVRHSEAIIVTDEVSSRSEEFVGAIKQLNIALKESNSLNKLCAFGSVNFELLSQMRDALNFLNGIVSETIQSMQSMCVEAQEKQGSKLVEILGKKLKRLESIVQEML